MQSALKAPSASTMAGVVATLVALVESVTTLVGALLSWIGGKQAPKEPSKTVSETSKGSTSSVGSSQTGSTTTTAATTPSDRSKTAAARTLQATRDDRGAVTVRTIDGYAIKAEGREQAWSIIGPDGHSTRIWGDPHVKESDGDRWDFKERSSFVFGDNKVTVETVPARNGRTYSARITIYNGAERITLGGIDKNAPTILAMSSDGVQHDDSLSDGVVFTRSGTKSGESWSATIGGKKKVMR
jgi:hypothetical protein